jgi:DNA polymerase-1
VGKLVLIDGNAILHRAFHALPPLTTKRGEPINAVYGLISMLLRVIQDLKPNEIAVCFDEKEPTFRHKEFKEYQAQRPVMANELSGQFEKARRVIEAFGMPIYSKPGFEADDVIGTLANQSKENVVIVTGDRDILQLVNNKVKVYMPIVGLSEGKLMGRQETLEKMGVEPELIPDYKALVGDPSDNYPGVPGIGPKTAINLLNEFGSVSEIYKNIKKIPPKLQEKLLTGEKSAELSYRLATIVKDVPVRLDEEAASRWDVDNKKVLGVFADFGFKTLTERVKKVGKQMDEEKQMSLI